MIVVPAEVNKCCNCEKYIELPWHPAKKLNIKRIKRKKARTTIIPMFLLGKALRQLWKIKKYRSGKICRKKYSE